MSNGELLRTLGPTNEIAAALAAAQSAFKNPERNRQVKVRTKTGGEYTFKYSTLDTIMDMVRAPLAANGLALSHSLEMGEHGYACFTKLLHSSGQQIECAVPIIVDRDANAQGWGSGITYARRYGVCALLAITADEDDDGNAACSNHAEQVGKGSGKAGFKPPVKTEEAKAAPKWSEMTKPERAALVESKIAECVKMQAAEGLAKLREISDNLNKRAADFEAADLGKLAQRVLSAEQDLNSGQ